MTTIHENILTCGDMVQEINANLQAMLEKAEQMGVRLRHILQSRSEMVQSSFQQDGLLKISLIRKAGKPP